jgi:transcriptional regulator with XRE-family HTH domain
MVMSEQRPFGDWLKRRRKALDLTQAALADQVGCSAATIRKLEDEERRPSAQIVDRLAGTFESFVDEGRAMTMEQAIAYALEKSHV